MNSSIKKRKTCSDIVKEIDIFGTTVDFSFKNSHSFGTIGGLILSIILVAFMLLFSILIIIDSLKFEKALTLTSYKPLDIPTDYINVVPDLPKEFKKGNKTNFDEEFLRNDKMTNQFAFSLVDVKSKKILPYDPTIFIINGFVLNETYSSYISYISNCNDYYPYTSKNLYELLELDKAYCFFSNFTLRNSYPSIRKIFEGLKISFKRCVNSTYAYVNKENNPSYIRLKANLNVSNAENPNKASLDNYSLMFDDTLFDSSNPSVYSYSYSSFYKINTNVVHRSILEAQNFNITDNVVCKTSSQIEYMVKNVKIVLYYNNFILNSTSDESPIIPKIEKLDCYLSSIFAKEKLIYLSYIKLITQNSLLPNSLSDRTITNFYLTFENENVIYADSSFSYLVQNNSSNFLKSNEDVDIDNEDLLKIIISLNNYRKEINRRYRDIFEIMGNIGGLSKILMMIAFFFIYYYANFRKKEALMNELYTNKHDLSSEILDETIKKNLEMIEMKLYEFIYEYCENQYKFHNFDKYEIKLKESDKKRMEIEDNKNIINNDKSENVEEDDFKEYIKNLKLLENIYKKLYFSFSDLNNIDALKVWKIYDDDKQHNDNIREQEFFRRIFCRAFVKFYFNQKASFYDYNNKKDIKNDKVFTLEKFESNLIDRFNDKNEKNLFIDYLLKEHINGIEKENYKNLLDSISQDNESKFSFNVFEIYFMICCKKISTKNFRKRCEDFENKYDEFLEQTDFKEIINSIQEFKTFKKTYFEKGQLWLFDSCPIKAITSNDKLEDFNKDNIPNSSNDVALERIFEKYYAKNQNRFFRKIKNNKIQEKTSLQPIIDDDESSNYNLSVLNDKEDDKFYDNLFSQLNEKTNLTVNSSDDTQKNLKKDEKSHKYDLIEPLFDDILDNEIEIQKNERKSYGKIKNDLNNNGNRINPALKGNNINQGNEQHRKFNVAMINEEIIEKFQKKI